MFTRCWTGTARFSKERSLLFGRTTSRLLENQWRIPSNCSAPTMDWTRAGQSLVVPGAEVFTDGVLIQQPTVCHQTPITHVAHRVMQRVCVGSGGRMRSPLRPCRSAFALTARAQTQCNSSRHDMLESAHVPPSNHQPQGSAVPASCCVLRAR